MFLLAAAVVFGVISVLADSNDNPAQGSALRSSSPGSHTGRPWLGLDTAGFAMGNGVPIADVIPGGPAYNAGLQPGDVISRIGNHAISQPTDVGAALAGLHPGDQVEIEFLRIPNTYTTTVTLGTTPPGYP